MSFHAQSFIFEETKHLHQTLPYANHEGCLDVKLVGVRITLTCVFKTSTYLTG